MRLKTIATLWVRSGLVAALVVLLVPRPAVSQVKPLPDWTKAGYRGTGRLPSANSITADGSCVITPAELAEVYQVRPDDRKDDSAGLQRAIDAIREGCQGSFEALALIELPAGSLHIQTEIHVDASFLIIRGQGSSGPRATRIFFEPGSDTVYDGIPDFDLSAMEGPGTSNGSWIWPGRGAFRVQTRAVHSSYARDYQNAPPNRQDFFEGSVNFHWKAGVELTQNRKLGDTTLPLASAKTFQVGDTIWVGAPNTARMYAEQGVKREDWVATEFMRQQIFTVTAIRGDTLSIDRPLEFDLPYNSTSDGSEAIDGKVRAARVVPLAVVEGVGLENFYLTQVLPGFSARAAHHHYTNLDPLRAMHGIVFKWATHSYVRGVHTAMTGSHALVTEMARFIQIEDSTFEGSWNKGAGGNGYVRLSKLWDSLFRRNTLIGMRHLALQWSASHNVVQGNVLDADINLHGGWERHNLIENNQVRVPFAHRECSPQCGSGDETWYPIWWGAGAHAGGWAGATGPRNVFYNNLLQKQTSPQGRYTDFSPYGAARGVVFMLGWDRNTASGSHWEHLAVNNRPIPSWTGREMVSYHEDPHAGVNARCTSTAPSLVGGEVRCASYSP